MTRASETGQSGGAAIADVLSRAAAILSASGAWGAGWYAKDRFGESVDTSDDAACRFCAMGAVYRAAGISSRARTPAPIITATRAHLSKVLGCGVAHWNDAPERTQQEVVAKLREAAALALAKGDAR